MSGRCLRTLNASGMAILLATTSVFPRQLAVLTVLRLEEGSLIEEVIQPPLVHEVGFVVDPEGTFHEASLKSY